MRELRAADAQEIAWLNADVEALVGALHQSTAENSQLHQRLVRGTDVVRVLPRLRTVDAIAPIPPGFV
ncbi:hypothetical protein [Streptomyces sp. SID2119]|uniref:hypothetical protein n=1 Tax=Streptomyces sp. SID2119 TaxID=2690253 RepID=UPI00136C7C51|nr:hypothetical protein [Streptomyces sp. SID2119]MYW29976.1 hypothetical protein [Streptomyces sp. SID2119]